MAPSDTAQTADQSVKAPQGSDLRDKALPGQCNAGWQLQRIAAAQEVSELACFTPDQLVDLGNAEGQLELLLDTAVHALVLYSGAPSRVAAQAAHPVLTSLATFVSDTLESMLRHSGNPPIGPAARYLRSFYGIKTDPGAVDGAFCLNTQLQWSSAAVKSLIRHHDRVMQVIVVCVAPLNSNMGLMEYSGKPSVVKVRYLLTQDVCGCAARRIRRVCDCKWHGLDKHLLKSCHDVACHCHSQSVTVDDLSFQLLSPQCICS
jgi:hypothetical protein